MKSLHVSTGENSANLGSERGIAIFISEKLMSAYYSFIYGRVKLRLFTA